MKTWMGRCRAWQNGLRSEQVFDGRLIFVDGLRGIAAFVVAVGHIIGMVPPDHPITTFAGADLEHKLIWPWLFGGQAVWLFILLSGFALYWSEESRIEAGRGRSPLIVYVRRRAWRILPTYYVSVALGLIAVFILGPILVAPSPSLDTFGPVTPGGLISHVVLVHNLDPSWVNQVNPPLWSIAVEAQLYLLFPLLVWAGLRWSPYLPALFLFLFAQVVNRLSPVPLFGLLMWFVVGAVLAHVARRYRLPRRTLLAVATGAGIVGLYRGPGEAGSQIGQLAWLVTFGCLVLALLGAPEGGLNLPTRRWIVILGHSSYSLYAVHFPVALLLWAGVGRLGLSHEWAMVAMIALALPAALLVTAVSYRLVERPSLTRVGAVGRAADQPSSGVTSGNHLQ